MTWGLSGSFGSSKWASGSFGVCAWGDACSQLINEAQNGDFSLWTLDDPDFWVVQNEDASNYITEVPGGANIVSDNTSNVQMSQNNMTVGQSYKISFTKTSHVSGFIRWQNPQTGAFENIIGTDANGTISVTVTANQPTLAIFRDNTGPTDYVMSLIFVLLL